MKIIVATKKDEPKIKELIEKLHDFELPMEELYVAKPDTAERNMRFFKRMIKNDNGAIFVAEIDNKIVGYAVCWIAKRPPYLYKVDKIGYISDVFVEDKYRMRGIGSALLGKVLEWFKNKNIKYVELSVLAKNEKAKKFYEKHGFKVYSLNLRKVVTDGKNKNKRN